MPKIFNYQDYRQFLADYYEEKKNVTETFSYQNFSRKAGFSSKSFLFNVIKGKKTLSRASVVKLSVAIGLSKTESAYFENLVYFNQAKTFSERNFYFEKLNEIHPVSTEASLARNLRKDQYEFYSQWYHVVIRSLLDMYPKLSDPLTISKMVYPKISVKEVQKSIDLLFRLGLVEKNKNGGYSLNSKIISSGKDLHSLAAQQFHLTCMEFASEALKKLPSDKRNVTGLTLGISKSTYDKICGEIQSFQERILSLAERDANSDSVYQLNFQLFPVSQKVNKRKTGSEIK